MTTETLLVALEGLLVFGGAMAFGLWQLHSIKKDQEASRKKAATTASQDKPSEES